jgi:hypothetical protein
MSADATTVRAKAAQLVRDHAARLGMDAMAAGVLVRAIEAIPVEDHTDVVARRMGAEFVDRPAESSRCRAR